MAPNTKITGVSTLLGPEEAVSLIPALAGEEITIEKLSGGLTNRSFIVCTESSRYVLRLDDEHTAAFGIDRSTELKARHQAAAAGLTAQVVFWDIEQSILLSDYLVGETWAASHLSDSRNLQRLAKLLRRVHSLPLLGQSFNAVTAAGKYLDAIADRPALHDFGQRCAEVVSETMVTDEFCCCHNDPIAANVVVGENLQLLDWEYARDNDPMFDLAVLIGYYNLDTAQTDILLSSYSGGDTAPYRDRLFNQIRLFDAVQWLWFALRHRVSPNAQLASRLEELQQRIK